MLMCLHSRKAPVCLSSSRWISVKFGIGNFCDNLLRKFRLVKATLEIDVKVLPWTE
jgi:hypothetical protein